jgi:hypothetical protein
VANSVPARQAFRQTLHYPKSELKKGSFNLTAEERQEGTELGDDDIATHTAVVSAAAQATGIMRAYHHTGRAV